MIDDYEFFFQIVFEILFYKIKFSKVYFFQKIVFEFLIFYYFNFVIVFFVRRQFVRRRFEENIYQIMRFFWQNGFQIDQNINIFLKLIVDVFKRNNK